MNLLIFDTEQEAIDAEAKISKQMGLPKYGINAATQEVDFNSIQIERWDIPRQLEDGKWTITSLNESDAIATDRQKLEEYLAWKWGLQGSLPPTHPYKNFPPKV
jgi:hypothetical protein